MSHLEHRLIVGAVFASFMLLVRPWVRQSAKGAAKVPLRERDGEFWLRLAIGAVAGGFLLVFLEDVLPHV
jgi:hypothetical protein